MASDISEQVRARVARRAGHRCEYCLIREDEAGFAHQVDHVVSRKHGGSSDFDNLDMPASSAIAIRAATSRRSIRGQEKPFGYSILGMIAGQIISVSTPISLSHSATLGAQQSGYCA